MLATAHTALARHAMLVDGMIITRPQIAAALAAVGLAAAVAFTPTSSSDASDAHPGPKSPNVGARHGFGAP
ncbi:MAG TPA: hypothetical protein VKB54_19785 [Solirubrobacteraceae bacterium]|nr:hypothetical protein [Solirubrobacteraceae bacterium]